jgi:WS/DGAT/MGAT family acyltransferase
MGMIAVQDASFLMVESREHPMHVATLQLFELPADAGSDYVSTLYAELLNQTDLRPMAKRRPANPVSSVGQLWWAENTDVDLEYHVRLSALPAPGQVRQLLELVSRLHGTLLDRHRPLWEFHLIEGLEGGRFAAYTKMHHALVDGVAGTRLVHNALSEDPGGSCRPFWAAQPGTAPKTVTNPFTEAAGALWDATRTTPAVARRAVELLSGKTESVPVAAPKTIFNVPITGARRFAAQSWDIKRLKRAAGAGGATLNDVVLAMSAGALRRYLLERQALPSRPLVAAVPVSLALRNGKSGGESGNAVGAVRCTLATHLADPARRLASISASMRTAKDTLAVQSPGQIQLSSTMVMIGPQVLAAIPGAVNVSPPMFNVIISNVPGPQKPLYWNGARMQGSYPVSIPFEGQALNITVTSYAGKMQFGLIGCRRRVTHLQHLLGYLEESLAELE